MLPTRPMRILTLLIPALVALTFAACESAAPTATLDIEATVSAAVAATAEADTQPTLEAPAAATIIPTPTPSVTPTPTAMPTPTPTSTPTLVPMAIPTSTPTATSIPIPTPIPASFPWTSFGPGTWHVGQEIVPGVYEANNVSGRCEWARLSRLDGDSVEVLFAETTTTPVVVAILPTDAGFRASVECGRWTLQPPPTPTPTHTPTPTPTPRPTISADFRAQQQHTTLSSGYGHACALRPDGRAVCWGRNDYGQASPPPGERFVSISAGAANTCALRSDGTVACWGSEEQASPPDDEQFASISSSGGHTCGLRPNGSAICWGGGIDSAGIATC